MNTNKENKVGFMETPAGKALFITLLTLILLIPTLFVRGLINERQQRSFETIQKINAKWSGDQTFTGPVLAIPFVRKTYDANGLAKHDNLIQFVAPEDLKIDAGLSPEERYYGIYKTILYKSDLDVSGYFKVPELDENREHTYFPEKAFLLFGVTDMKGVTDNIEFLCDGKKLMADIDSERTASNDMFFRVDLEGIGVEADEKLSFSTSLKLNGSSSLNFVPMGRKTEVVMTGSWNNPGFTGGFSPESTMSQDTFTAKWNILYFNRQIPDKWTARSLSFHDSIFGVNLVETVDHYQQSERSAKYAFMFIALTFAVIYFIEILSKKRIHIIQYLLVGIALILFYTLLLSLSEQTGFLIAYILAAVSTITLITCYTYSIFRNKKTTAILTGELTGLYVFLYIVLQLEDIALLTGSIGLFLILAVIMYLSRKVDWYQA